MDTETVRDVVAGAPAATVAGLKVFGVSLPDWAAIVAIIYTSAMLAEFAVRKYRYYFHKKGRRATDER